MTDLQNYFNNNSKREIHKWLHYFEIYEFYFNKYRNKEVIILEIGVSQGGSLQMWKEYFGEGAKIYGIDIDPRCKEFEENNIEIFIGSQSDEKFLSNIKTKIGEVDILIDDGGHTMNQQIVTFNELFSIVKSDGIYLCEDVCTSYWFTYGGGYKRRGTFIQFTKKLIDKLNAYHSKQSSLKVDEFTNTAYSIHYYDSVIVILKKKKIAPINLKTGIPTFDYILPKPKTKFQFLLNKFTKTINYILMKLRLPNFFKTDH